MKDGGGGLKKEEKICKRLLREWASELNGRKQQDCLSAIEDT